MSLSVRDKLDRYEVLPRARYLVILTALAFAHVLFGQTTQYDLVITGGKIVDGSGGSWYYGDVAIQGDTIVAMGKLSPAAGVRRLDAHGMVVAPGFIDPHTHSRRGIFDDPFALNYIRQGVTTLMEGPDGSSPLPIKDFLDQIAAAHTAPNFGTFVGQGSIRESVMGLVNRKATPEEIEKMRQVTRQAMLDGAFGLSTGLFYVPGNFTPTEEVVELAKVAGAMGGMHTSHMRDEAANVLDSVKETIRIGEEGGLPTQITHHKIIGRGNWGLSKETLRLVEEARARGVDATIDAYPYTASSTGTAALIPQWAQEGGQKALVERLDAPEQRTRIKTAVVAAIEGDRGGGDPANVVMAACGFDPALAGKSLADITRERGRAVNFGKCRRDATGNTARRRLSGGLPCHKRRRRRAHSPLSVHDDRLRRRGPAFRSRRAASTQLRDVRAGSGAVCAGTQDSDAGGCRAPHVRYDGGTLKAIRSRTVAPRHESRHRDLRSRHGSR